MYEVSIKQKVVKHLDTDAEYTTEETVTLTIKAVEDIETIIGLFADNSSITITKIKEDN